MRTLVGFGLSLLLAIGLFAQHRGGFSNPHPFPQGTFGNVTFPAAAPGWVGRRLRGKALDATLRSGHTPARDVVMYGFPVTYAYPVYVGGHPDNANPAEPAPHSSRYHGE